jgi:ferredoxin-NADP reductase
MNQSMGLAMAAPGTPGRVAPLAAPPPPAAAAEIEVVVEDIVQEAEGVIGIGLLGAGGRELPAWSAGAHIDLLLDAGLERQYSLCGDAGDRRRWRVAVLREPHGRGGSEWLHTRLRQGEVLRARGPRNNFPLVDAVEYLFIAGGIGITPILAMIRALRRDGRPWRLLYGGRRRGSMAFVDELESCGGQVQIRPEDQCGLLDLAGWLGAPKPGAAVYCCGPERLLEAVEARCSQWPEGALHVERFQARPGALAGASEGFEVVLAQSGLRCRVQPGQTIIDALDGLGVHVPRSCGEGTCGTCLTAVVDGIPDHRDSFLMGKKRAANQSICVCCSRSLGPRLVLDL